MNKLNMLRNLSKMNKEKRDENVASDNMKDEIYKRGIGNVLKLSNFLKNKKDNATANPLPARKMSPTSMVKESIKNYIKSNPTVKKYNDIYSEEEANNDIPFNENNTENIMHEYEAKIKEQNATKKNFYKNLNEENFKKINEEGIEEEKAENEDLREDYLEARIGEGNISEIRNVSNRKDLEFIEDLNKDVLSDSFETDKAKPIINKVGVSNGNGYRAQSAAVKDRIQITGGDKKIKEIESKKNSEVVSPGKQIVKVKVNLINETEVLNNEEIVNHLKSPKNSNNINLNNIKTDLHIMLQNSINNIENFERKVNKKLDYLENRIETNSKWISKAITKQAETHKAKLKSTEDEIKKVTEERVYKDTVEKVKKEIENSTKREKEPPILNIWKNVLKDVENSNLNTAFTRILETGI
jgi:hypothetical protein